MKKQSVKTTKNVQPKKQEKKSIQTSKNKNGKSGSKNGNRSGGGNVNRRGNKSIPKKASEQQSVRHAVRKRIEKLKETQNTLFKEVYTPPFNKNTVIRIGKELDELDKVIHHLEIIRWL